MKLTALPVAILFAGVLIHQQSNAQGFLKKLKDKVEKKATEAIDKKIADKSGLPNGNSATNPTPDNAGINTSGNRGMNRPNNQGGEGLKNTTPPDVLQQISDADHAFTANQLGEARFSIQQALLGVELQIGRELLRSLPTTINNLPVDSADDRVMSTRYGWNNLNIQRIYQQNDKQFSLLIGNNAMYAGVLDMYMGFAATQSNGETQDTKQIRVKGNKGIIKFDQREGYTVLLQLGQSGMITFQGINFATEKEMMDAINQFDIDLIKKSLGE